MGTDSTTRQKRHSSPIVEQATPPGEDQGNRPETWTFLADAMLGRLTRWLRVLGYDAQYRRDRSQDLTAHAMEAGRLFLTRDHAMAGQESVLMIQGDRVGDQITGLKALLHLAPDPQTWFTRCLSCNCLLEDAQPQKAKEEIPEFVFYHNALSIRFCPCCGRHFWPGSHRRKMEMQLREWGFG